MSELIGDYLDELLNSLGGASPPIDPSVLKSLYGRRDYAAMLGWIKNSMRLDLRVGLRIVDAPEPSPPMWIETQQPMPAYGGAGFRNARVIVNARRDALEAKSFVWVVAGFSHELSHVVLFAIGHRLQRDEKAVDLTAMILGYPSFVAPRKSPGRRESSGRYRWRSPCCRPASPSGAARRGRPGASAISRAPRRPPRATISRKAGARGRGEGGRN